MSLSKFYSSQATKNGTLAWATSATYVDITGWTAVQSEAYATALSGNGIAALSPNPKATLTAAIPYTGSTAGVTHQVRIQKNGVTVGSAGTSVTTASGTATCTVTGVSIAAGDVITVQMSGGASSGTITATTPTLTISEPVTLGFAGADEMPNFWSHTEIDNWMTTFNTAVGGTSFGSFARLTASWNAIQPVSNSAWDWTNTDYLYNAANNAGINIYCQLYGYRPVMNWVDTPADYANLAYAVAARYPFIKWFEIWNEANADAFWGRTAGPVEYTSYLIAAATAIRNARPDAKIVTGANMANPFTTTPNQAHSFLQGIYDNGGRHYLDAVGMHPYDYGPSGQDNWPEVDLVRGVMKTNGDHAKPIIISELGWPTALVSVAQRNTNVSAAANQIASRSPWCKAMLMYYSLRDSPMYLPTDNQGSFGFYDSNYVLKT